MTIATRAAAARPEETAGLLNELFLSTGRPYDSDFDWYVAKNTPESLLAAAMMLAPQFDGGSHVDFHLRPGVTVARVYTDDDTDFKGLGKTPALALIAAIAASRGV